jgi:hypothetical protein
MHNFKNGDKILWQYTHATGRKTRFERVKKGIFIRYTKSGNAVIALDGNTRYSYKPAHELRLAPTKDQKKGSE